MPHGGGGPQRFPGEARQPPAHRHQIPPHRHQILRGLGRDIDIIKLNGSIEIAPILGLSDVIVDIVETGKTLKENDLEVKAEIVPISARLIANHAAYQFQYDAIRTLVRKLEEQL